MNYDLTFQQGDRDTGQAHRADFSVHEARGEAGLALEDAGSGGQDHRHEPYRCPDPEEEHPWQDVDEEAPPTGIRGKSRSPAAISPIPTVIIGFMPKRFTALAAALYDSVPIAIVAGKYASPVARES